MSDEASPAAPPEWFTRAMAAPRESRFVEVAGCSIHYLRWGDPKRPGLLFVPASGGHAHWFAHIAPLFADQFNVVAIDLAGCGDSGRRDVYVQDLVSAEIAAVCADAGMLDAATPPIWVGHSVGGMHAVRAAQLHDDRLLGVIAVDALRYADLEKDSGLKYLNRPRAVPKPSRIYESFEEAVARFRPAPQPLIPLGHEYVLDHVARNSFKKVEGGWTSKYDTSQASLLSIDFALTRGLKDLKCAAAVIYGEHTHLADDTAADAVTDMNNGKVTVFRMPGTSHFPIFDSPLAFVAAIKGVALTWIAESKRTKA